jgi:hypothetical protein
MNSKSSGEGQTLIINSSIIIPLISYKDQLLYKIRNFVFSQFDDKGSLLNVNIIIKKNYHKKINIINKGMNRIKPYTCEC